MPRIAWRQVQTSLPRESGTGGTIHPLIHTSLYHLDDLPLSTSPYITLLFFLLIALSNNHAKDVDGLCLFTSIDTLHVFDLGIVHILLISPLRICSGSLRIQQRRCRTPPARPRGHLRSPGIVSSTSVPPSTLHYAPPPRHVS